MKKQTNRRRGQKNERRISSFLKLGESSPPRDRVHLLDMLHTDRLAHMVARSPTLYDTRTKHTLSHQFPPGNRKYTNILIRQEEKKKEKQQSTQIPAIQFIPFCASLLL